MDFLSGHCVDIQRKTLKASIESLKTRASELDKKWHNSTSIDSKNEWVNEFSALRCELRSLQVSPPSSVGVVPRVVHFLQAYMLRFLFDGGLLLSKLSTQFDKDVVLRWVVGEDSVAYQQHLSMRSIQIALNKASKQIADSAHTDSKTAGENSIISDIVYWGLKVILYMIGPIAAYLIYQCFNAFGYLGGFSFLFSMPTMAPYAIAFMHLFKICQVFGSTPQDVILSALSSLWWRSFAIVKHVQKFSLIYRRREESWWRVTKNHLLASINPTGVDWWVFFQGFFVVFLSHARWMVPVLMSYQSKVNVLHWVICAVALTFELLIQTLEEEVEFRAPLIQKKQSMSSLVVNILGGALLFGYVHMSNPEFSALGDGIYPHLANVLGYVIAGLRYTLLTYIYGGVEFAWGMHFANNLMIAVLVGYSPSPLKSLPWLTFYRGEGSNTNNFMLSINSIGKLVTYAGELCVDALRDAVRVYLSIPCRDLYPVEAVQLNLFESATEQTQVSDSKISGNPIDDVVNHWVSTLGQGARFIQDKFTNAYCFLEFGVTSIKV